MNDRALLSNDIAVQRPAREGAQRPTRRSVCNGRFGRPYVFDLAFKAAL